MTATDADALLATIRADPKDDAPRLVYADWLDEQGEGERAEFIRVQCKIAWLESEDGGHHPNMLNHPGSDYRTGMCVLCDKATDLGRRERKLLLYENCKKWLPEGFAVGNGNNGPWGTNTCEAVFRRGFVAEVRAPLATLIGGVCEGCYGNDEPAVGAGHGNYRRRNCPACRGTGRTPGLRDLVRREPVEEVRVTDREPDPIGDTEFCWLVERPGLVAGRAGLPTEIFRLLSGGRGESAGPDWQEMYGHEDHWVVYPTHAAAHAALGRAVLAHLRADG